MGTCFHFSICSRLQTAIFVFLELSMQFLFPKQKMKAPSADVDSSANTAKEASNAAEQASPRSQFADSVASNEEQDEVIAHSPSHCEHVFKTAHRLQSTSNYDYEKRLQWSVLRESYSIWCEKTKKGTENTSQLENNSRPR